jgi:hypothetical protein
MRTSRGSLLNVARLLDASVDTELGVPTDRAGEAFINGRLGLPASPGILRLGVALGRGGVEGGVRTGAAPSKSPNPLPVVGVPVAALAPFLSSGSGLAFPVRPPVFVGGL